MLLEKKWDPLLVAKCINTSFNRVLSTENSSIFLFIKKILNIKILNLYKKVINLVKAFMKFFLSSEKMIIFLQLNIWSLKLIIILWWARQDSNLGPIHYECTALTNWATGPNKYLFLLCFIIFINKQILFKRKKYWMIPIIILLFVLGSLFVLGQGTPFAPLIYTIF